MATAIREREQTQTTSNGRVEVSHHKADPNMTRAARDARTAWRLEHLDEWRAGLERLTYYDPRYEYDIGHEYEVEWTTDPEQRGGDVHLLEYDEDGVLTPLDDRGNEIQYPLRDTARDRLDNRVEAEADFYFPAHVGARAGLYTEQGKPSRGVRPDLMVLPRARALPPGRYRDTEDREIDLNKGHAAPELVLEILSKSTAARDLEAKMRLYEALGVTEYVLYDVVGGNLYPDSPPGLHLYCLEDGAYQRVPPSTTLTEPGKPAVPSKVFGTHIRMYVFHSDRDDADAPLPRFQWHDPDTGRWRDRETDTRDRMRAEGRMEGRMEERMENAVALLNQLLVAELSPNLREQIAAHWKEHGLPPNVIDRILAVQQAPNEWRSLLLPGTGSKKVEDRGRDRPPSPPTANPSALGEASDSNDSG